jgi:PAS domain S-box-containing protein
MRVRSPKKAPGSVSPAPPVKPISGGDPRSIVEQLPQAIWVADAQGAIVHCNQYWHKFSGLDLVQTAESGWFSILHPEDRPSARASWRKLVTSGTAMQGEYRFLRARDGEYRWHLVQGVSIKEGNGIQKIGSAVDIHIQKSLELDLKKREDQLNVAIEAGRFGIWDFAPAERTFNTSYRARAMFGHPLDVELTYEEFIGMLHDGDRVTLRQAYSRALEPGGLSEFEISYRITRPDGAVRWIAARGKGVFSGVGSERKAERLIGTVQDITDRKTAEKALRDSEEKFRTAFHSNPEAMTITTLADGVYLDVNDAFLRVTGFSREDVMGRKSFHVRSWVEKEDRERLVQILKSKGSVESMETSFRKKNGEIFFVHLSAKLIEIGKLQCVLATSQDVTEHRRVVEELRISEEQHRSLIDRAPYGICRISAQGRFLLVNPALARMLGYETLSELLQLDLATQVYEDPAERARIIATLTQDMSKVRPIETRWKRQDSRTITVRLSGTPIRDGQGRLLHSEVFVERVAGQ